MSITSVCYAVVTKINVCREGYVCAAQPSLMFFSIEGQHERLLKIPSSCSFRFNITSTVHAIQIKLHQFSQQLLIMQKLVHDINCRLHMDCYPSKNILMD